MDDVAKLLAFFTHCKQQNPQFYCDFQLDKDGKIVSIFWSNASMQGENADFGDAVTFDTTHKTNLYQKHWPCLWVQTITSNALSLGLLCLATRQQIPSSGYLTPSRHAWWGKLLVVF
jgi:hypothetical protein